MKVLLADTLLVLLPSVFPSSTAARSVQGDSWCGNLMCVAAFVNESVVTYRMSASGQIGWMAIGFGTLMADSAMVIMWPNADGSVTLSQRTAPGFVEPTEDKSPLRIAQMFQPMISLHSAEPSLSFHIPRNSDVNQSITWAISAANPGSSDPGSFLEEHIESGTTVLDLGGTLDTDSITSITAVHSTSSTPAPNTISALFTSAPLPPNTMFFHMKLVIIHASLSAFGFLLLLPFGALVARWGRAFTLRWFHYHWIIQVISLPVIIIGWSMGVLAVADQGVAHVDDGHKICGMMLLPLYLAQLGLGSLIHFRKPRNGPVHPPRNIIHALLGIGIIGLAFYQVRTGFQIEWTKSTGRPINDHLLTNVWEAWVIFVPLVYFFGFFVLRKQLGTERQLSSYLYSPQAHVRHSPPSSVGIRDILELGPLDDGTHDMYSETPNEVTQAPHGVEMREVERRTPIILASSRSR